MHLESKNYIAKTPSISQVSVISAFLDIHIQSATMIRTQLVLAIAVLSLAAFANGEKVYRVDKSIRPPKSIGNCQPDLSSLKRPANSEIQGTVLMLVTLDRDGNVQHVKVERGLGRDINEKVVEAIGNCKFEPAVRVRDGEPVSVELPYEINFNISSE